MQASKLNVILFEDAESQRRFEQKGGEGGLTEMTQLYQRILRIQTEEKNIRERLQGVLELKSNESGRLVYDQQRKNLEDILMFLERKLQMLAYESSQTIEEIKEEVQRLLTREMLNRKMKKFQGKEDISRIERIYQQKIQMLEDNYRSELESVQRKNEQIQTAFEHRLAQFEQRMQNKVRDHDATETRLKDRIRQLEEQLHNLNRTKEPPHDATTLRGTVPTFTSLPDQNRNTVDTKQYRAGRQNAIDDVPAEKQSVSRIRRNKIFDRDSRPKRRHQQQQSISPIRTVDYSDIASVKLLNRDLDRFEDFKQLDMDGSDEDVFFYPEANRESPTPKQHQPLQQFAYQVPLTTQAVVSSFKLEVAPPAPTVFSPFDLK